MLNTLDKIPSLNYFSQFLFLSFLLFASACSGGKKIKGSKLSGYQQIIETSPVFNRSFTGFHLYDPTSKKVLYSEQADLYFTPASNTKIFTLYTSMNILRDSIPALRYIESGDSLIFWGTGDPSLEHPYLSPHSKVVDFLKKQDKQLFYCSSNFNDAPFGAGWAWDDYYYSFQPEKSALPFHGNIITVNKTKNDPYFRVEPGYFSNSFIKNDSIKGGSLKRLLNNNIFEYNSATQQRSYKNDHPFIHSDELVVNLLKDLTQKNIRLLSGNRSIPKDSKTIYSVPVDTLYKTLMQDSDNLIAEQLLLICSDAIFKNLNTKQIISYAKDSLFYDLPDEPIWRDGSGLSRYNLFTPRSIVYLLDKIYSEIPQDRLFSIFPAGGLSGTIKNWYAGNSKPYVFAKTGTLSNNHCLSGYLVASSGKVLIFSFMHNNFKGSSKVFKQEMERVLWGIYLNN